jgi:beta-phosphoglucomutase-like phosphatase (HAD superfamily)
VTKYQYILFDHDGVLVDTERWYYQAGRRALADIGFTVDQDQYLQDMNQDSARGPEPGQRASMNGPSADSERFGIPTTRST